MATCQKVKHPYIGFQEQSGAVLGRTLSIVIINLPQKPGMQATG